MSCDDIHDNGDDFGGDYGDYGGHFGNNGDKGSDSGGLVVMVDDNRVGEEADGGRQPEVGQGPGHPVDETGG